LIPEANLMLTTLPSSAPDNHVEYLSAPDSVSLPWIMSRYLTACQSLGANLEEIFE
jgi:hypothetical protein